MELIQSKNIVDYSVLLDGLYPDFGNHFCHTILCWCEIMEVGEQPKRKEGKFWEVWIVRDHLKNTLGICGLYSLSESTNELWLGWFGILPELRSSGIGAHVINQLKVKAKNIGAAALMSYVDEDGKPLNFYYRHGFGVIDKVGNYIDENNLSMDGFEDRNDFVIKCPLD